MPPYLLVFLSVFFSLSLPGQSLDRYITQYAQPEGHLAFFKPTTWKSATGEKLAIDFTFFFSPTGGNGKMGITRTVKNRKKPQKLLVRLETSDGLVLFEDTEPTLLFLDKRGKKWVERYLVEFPASQYETLLRTGTPNLVWQSPPTQNHFQPAIKWDKMSSVVYPILGLEFEKWMEGN